jgi:hypothetical protein
MTQIHIEVTMLNKYNVFRQTNVRNEFAKWRRYKHINRKLKFLK